MLTSLIALTLAFSPADLDGSPHRAIGFTAPADRVTAAAARPESDFGPAPMVTAEGRAARLLTDEQLSRVRAIDAQLESSSTLPWRVLGGLGGVVASAPFAFAAGVAVFVVAELASYAAVTLLLSFYTLPGFFLTGLTLVPVWGWVAAAMGLGVAMVAGLTTSRIEAQRAALVAERHALIESTRQPPLDATTLVPIGTF